MSSRHAGRAPGQPDRWASVQGAALVVGALFVLVGTLGFVPGVTDYDGGMTIAGHGSGAMLFHFFQVSVLHNVVHLTSGVVGLMMARTVNGARAYLVGGGLIYLALFGYGYLIEQGSPANVIPVNTADNWLHLVFGAGMVMLGAATGRPGAVRRSRFAARPTGSGV